VVNKQTQNLLQTSYIIYHWKQISRTT